MNINMGLYIGFTLGPDIYVGWVSGTFALVAGALLIYAGCREEIDDDAETDKVWMITWKMYGTGVFSQPGRM